MYRCSPPIIHYCTLPHARETCPETTAESFEDLRLVQIRPSSDSRQDELCCGLFEHLLVGGRVLDAVAQLGLVTFAARQGDVGKQVQYFAGWRWGRAGWLQTVTPLRGWSYGRG